MKIPASTSTTILRSPRRNFLKAVPALAATVMWPACFGSASPAAVSEPDVKFPTEPRARLAVASYPFRKFFESPHNYDRDPRQPGMDLPEFASMVVERFNVHNIEPLSSHFRSNDLAYLSELRAAFDKAGVHVVDIAANVQHSFYDPDASKRAAAVERGKTWVDVAAALGSPSVRTHIEGVHNVTPHAGRTADSLKQLAAYGARKNVVIDLENDDLESEDACFIVKVIDAVASPWLRALPDFCNSMLTGIPEYNYDALALMFKHAYNISHMKDSETDDQGTLYTTDVARTFEIAKSAGYRGYFSMEWDRPGDPYEGTQKLIDESLKYLA